MANTNFSTMTIEEINAVIKLGQAAKRSHKVKAAREAKLQKWNPFFDAVDKVIDKLGLNEEFTKPAAARFHFDESGHIVRETVRFYNQANYSGVGGNGNGGNRKAVEVDMDGKGNWKAFKSHADACREMKIPFDGNSPVRALHGALPDERIRAITVNSSS